MVLLVGLSVRALAASAQQEGLAVCTVDACADMDTRRLARGGWWYAPAPAMRFDAEGLLALILRVVQSRPLRGWVAGAGLEAEPGLIDAITRESGLPLYGNPAAVVERLNDPACLREFGLTAPTGSAADGWLLKQRGGCGGGHVRSATSRSCPGPGMYLQPRIAGQAGSAVFLADGHRLRLLGMNRLYPLAPAQGDYRHAVVMRTRPGSLPAGLWRLVRGTGLKGLCGMDFIVGSGGQMHILELNPRPPASAELHTQSALTLHLQACAGRLHCRHIRAGRARALAVCYARRRVQIPAALHWPAWVADCPPPGRIHQTGEPVCTIQVAASSEAAVWALLARRLRILQQRLGPTDTSAAIVTRVSPA